MTNTVDELLAAVANSRVADIAAGSTKELGQRADVRFLAVNRRLESVTWVVTVLRADVAREAKVIILAIDTSDEVGLGEDYNALDESTTRFW